MTNLLRQMDMPLLARVGQQFEITIHAGPGFTPFQQFALPVLAFAEARLPLPPFGTFGLDPAAMATLPLQVIAPPGGAATIAVSVPHLPVLSGLDLFTQAVVFDPIRTARLTNSTADLLFH